MKVARVAVRFEVPGETPVPPEPEKVRYATQRRGRTTKPFMASLHLTISVRSGGTFATGASTCHALKPPSAQIGSSHRKHRRILSSTSPAPGDAIARDGDRDDVYRHRAGRCDDDRHPIGTSRSPGRDPCYGWRGALRIEPGLEETD